MYEMLQRIENDPPITGDFDLSDDELDSDDDGDEEYEAADGDDDDDLAKRLEGVDLNDADAIWSLLNENEREEFNKIVQSEDVTSILPKFNAWWETKVKKKLITEMNGDETGDDLEQSTESVDHPKIIETIKDFGLISTKPPAPCVTNNLINVLAAYASMVRYFYGEPETNKFDAVDYLLAICANLRVNANFDDSAVAIESIRQDAHNEGYAIDEPDVQQIQNDIECFMNGPIEGKQTNTFMLAALSELHRLFSATKAAQKYTNGTKDVNGSAGPANSESSHSFSKSESSPTQQAPSPSDTSSSEQAKASDQFSKRFSSSQRSNECKHLEKVKLTALIKKVEYYLAYVNKFL